MKKGQIIIFSLLVLLALNACKLKKEVKDTEAGLDANTMQIWNDLNNSNIDYEWFYAKANCQLTYEGMTLGGKADIRIRKDSVILLSIRKLGFELFRSLIRPDSVFGISRLEGNYFAMPMDSIKNEFQIPFNYQQLQDLIVGNHIVENQIPVRSQNTQQGYIFSSMNKELRIDYLLKEDFQVYESIFVDTQGRSFVIEMGKYTEFEKDISLAFKRDYSYPEKDNPEYRLSIDLDKVEINNVKKIKFEIPSSYTEM